MTIASPAWAMRHVRGRSPDHSRLAVVVARRQNSFAQDTTTYRFLNQGVAGDPGQGETMAAMHRFLAAVGATQLLLGIPAARSEEAPRIKISFVLVSDLVEPKPVKDHHSAYSATLTLGGSNQVGEDWQQTTVGGQAPYHAAQSQLGKTWRVLSASTVQGTWRMPNYTKTVTVHVSGKSCSVTFDSQLDSGETTYKTRTGGVVYSHTKLKMVDPVCTVGG
jgi:hypothetical protein